MHRRSAEKLAASLSAEPIAGTARGAFPCTGFLALSEFEPEFLRWGMTTVIKETDP
jgi:hypothetical protein